MLKFLPVLFIVLLCFNVMAGDIIDGKSAGSIVLQEKDSEVTYEDITGDRNGFYRKLIHINDSPALWVSSKYDFYYTLVIIEHRILIDCAYFDVRNIYNGARATAGVCDLGIPLEDNYDEIGQKYSNNWRNTIYSFDTSAVYENGQGSSFFLGKIGDIGIYDRYSSLAELENGTPQKIIKSTSGCFSFQESVGFLMFLSGRNLHPQYLDVLQPEDPMRIQRLYEEDLKKLAVEKCD